MTSSTDIDQNKDTSGSGSAEEVVHEAGERLVDTGSGSFGSGESDLTESKGENDTELRRRSKVARAHPKKSHKPVKKHLKHGLSSCENAEKKNRDCVRKHGLKTRHVTSNTLKHHKNDKKGKGNSDSNDYKVKLTKADHDENDVFLRKVKTAVRKLKKFDFNNPKTNKALKEIIIHAKRVVAEAKTVLHDVNSVVRSVQNFVTGNYENVDDDEEEEEVSMTLPDENSSLEDSADEAREKAERAARKASVAAKRAQAASKMAVEIADNFWDVAKKSRALSKLRDDVSNINKEALRKLVILHEQDREASGDKQAEEKAAKTQSKPANDMKTNNTEADTKNTTHAVATKVVSQERFRDRNFTQNDKANEPVPVHAVGEATNFLSEADQDLSAKASSYADRLWSEEGLKSRDVGSEQSKQVTKIEQKSEDVEKQDKLDDSEQAKSVTKIKQNSEDANKQNKLITEVLKIARTDADLAKKMADLVKHKVQDLRKIKSKITENKELKQLTSHVKKILETPKDINEVVKSDRFSHNAQNKASPKSNEKKSDKVEKEDQVETSAKVSIASESNHVKNSDQSEPTVSGSYDVELEVEPEQLELTNKPGGQMKEKKIRIKNTAADGQARKISPVTFAKILKAIRKVEGILGFTIEKQQKENEKHLATITQAEKRHKL